MFGGRLAKTADGQVICFRSPGKKNDFVLFCAKQGCYFPSSPVDRGAGFLAKKMHTRGIAKLCRQVRHHGLDYSCVNGSCCAVIQIDSAAVRHRNRHPVRQPRPSKVHLKCSSLTCGFRATSLCCAIRTVKRSVCCCFSLGKSFDHFTYRNIVMVRMLTSG